VIAHNPLHGSGQAAFRYNLAGLTGAQEKTDEPKYEG
jgi:hypothetical protein